MNQNQKWNEKHAPDRYKHAITWGWNLKFHHLCCWNHELLKGHPSRLAALTVNEDTFWNKLRFVLSIFFPFPWCTATGSLVATCRVESRMNIVTLAGFLICCCWSERIALLLTICNCFIFRLLKERSTRIFCGSIPEKNTKSAWNVLLKTNRFIWKIQGFFLRLAFGWKFFVMLNLAPFFPPSVWYKKCLCLIGLVPRVLSG